MAKRGFRRATDGSVVARLPAENVELLKIVLGDVSTVVAEPPPGPISDRLFQRAYDDPTAEVAEQIGISPVALRVRMTRLRQRLAAAGVVTDWL